MDEIAPGVYVETGYSSGNVGFIDTGVGIVGIDAPMLPSDVRHWRTQIRSVTDQPFIAVVQTDYDRSRVVGIRFLGVPTIAHDSAWDKMRVYSSDKVLAQIRESLRSDAYEGEWRAHMPDITFSERLTLCKGKRQIHVVHGGGHSPATCMVHLPAEGLVFAGDVVCNGLHPSMALAETKQWLLALNQLRKMPVDLIVPGHGACCDREATHAVSDYIRDMRAMVRRSFQSGRSKSETSSAVIPEFLGAFPYDGSEREQVRQRIKGGSDRIYDEYRAQTKAGAARSRSKPDRSKSRKPKKRS